MRYEYHAAGTTICALPPSPACRAAPAIWLSSPRGQVHDTFLALNYSAIGTCAAGTSKEHPLTDPVPLGGSPHRPSSFHMVWPAVPDTCKSALHQVASHSCHRWQQVA